MPPRPPISNSTSPPPFPPPVSQPTIIKGGKSVVVRFTGSFSGYLFSGNSFLSSIEQTLLVSAVKNGATLLGASQTPNVVIQKVVGQSQLSTGRRKALTSSSDGVTVTIETQFQARDLASAKQFAIVLKENPSQVFPSSIFGNVKVSSIKVLQGLTVGQRVGIAIGVTAAVAGCLAGAFFWYCRYRSKELQSSCQSKWPCRRLWHWNAVALAKKETPPAHVNENKSRSTTEGITEGRSEEISLRQLYEVKQRPHPSEVRPRPDNDILSIPRMRPTLPMEVQGATVFMFNNPLATDAHNDYTIALHGGQFHGGPPGRYGESRLQMRPGRLSDRSNLEIN